eukprot:2353125-Karenia_brevis.AAC.1
MFFVTLKAPIYDSCQQDWPSGNVLCNFKSSDLRQLSARLAFKNQPRGRAEVSGSHSFRFQ